MSCFSSSCPRVRFILSLDCTTGVTYEPEARPGVANLLEIMAAVANVREARDRAKNALVAAGNGNFSGVTITEDGAVDLVPWTKVTPQVCTN